MPQSPRSTSPAGHGSAGDSRRGFLRKGAVVAGAILGGAGAVQKAAAAPLEIPPTAKEMGRPVPATAYGMPSRFEAHVTRRRTDVFVNRQNWSDWTMTPLQHQHGTVTPNGLIFERHHGGIPDIDPATHRLAVHGMVKQPLVFGMNDLLRYPSVSKFYFLECSGNTLADWTKAASSTVQQTHGMLSGAEWTGIPAAWILNEAGLDPGAKWVLFEGADGSSHTRSIPLEKVMDDTLLVYAQNGEMLRPENGYPLRAFIPGWEGNVSVKWLRRIKVSDQPWHFRSETARYTDPLPEGKWRQFSFVMECKSVITRPSGGMKLERPGAYEIQGFAWSGRGRITAVDVSVDGGRNWQPATVEAPALDKALTRFRYPWTWDGSPARVQSRAMDSTGYVQPSVPEIGRSRALVGFIQHHNGIFPWSISASGEVKNAIA
jgi:sulfane dehydrogenase subunit SoxC